MSKYPFTYIFLHFLNYFPEAKFPEEESSAIILGIFKSDNYCQSALPSLILWPNTFVNVFFPLIKIQLLICIVSFWLLQLWGRQNRWWEMITRKQDGESDLLTCHAMHFFCITYFSLLRYWWWQFQLDCQERTLGRNPYRLQPDSGLSCWQCPGLQPSDCGWHSSCDSEKNAMLSPCLSRPALKPVGKGGEKKVGGTEAVEGDQIIDLVTACP